MLCLSEISFDRRSVPGLGVPVQANTICLRTTVQAQGEVEPLSPPIVHGPRGARKMVRHPPTDAEQIMDAAPSARRASPSACYPSARY